MHHRAYASREYVERHGTPEKLADLDRHKLIAYDESFHQPFTPINWLLSEGIKGRRRESVLRVNNIYGMFRACASGLGIASLPDYMAQLTRGLVSVLPELAGPRFDAYLVYPEELRHSKRIEVFRDFLVRQIERHKA
jgi:DNA-binding transcriptional LysR family regulator